MPAGKTLTPSHLRGGRKRKCQNQKESITSPHLSNKFLKGPICLSNNIVTRFAEIQFIIIQVITSLTFKNLYFTKYQEQPKKHKLCSGKMC